MSGEPTPEQLAQAEAAGVAAAVWVQDHAGWIVLALLAFAFWLRWSGRRRDDARRAAEAFERPAASHAQQQGRVTADELARALPMPKDGHGVPLGYTHGGGKRARAAGVPWRASRGHVGVFGPTGTGKGFHATDALLRWPGSALVIDPKGEQWARTAGHRAARYGPVYRIPAGGVDLAAMFDLGDALARRELYECLLRPHLDREPHWLERIYPLFEAAHLTGAATGAHPLRLLARWAQLPPDAVVAEAAPHAPRPVAVLTAGQRPAALAESKAFEASWAAFTSRLSPIAEQIRFLALPPEAGGVPADWAQRRATVYVTFPIQSQGAIGPIVAALVAGVLRRLERVPPPHRTLLALDEAPTVGLPKLSNYLATIRGEAGGVTALVYCQSLSQLEATYGKAEAAAILTNCSAGQLFLPPKDLETADYLSRVFGDELEAVATASGGEQSGSTSGAGNWGSHNSGRSTSWSVATRYRRALTESAALGLPEGTVAVFAAGKRALLADSRTVLASRLPRFPPPPEPAPGPDEHASPTPVAAAAPPPPSPAAPDAAHKPKPGETTPPPAAKALW